MSPTVWRGSRLEYGSWNTIWNCRRRRRSSVALERQQVLAVQRDRALVRLGDAHDRCGRWSSCRSRTRPRGPGSRPRRMVNETPSTAWTQPRAARSTPLGMGNQTCRSVDLRAGSRRRSWPAVRRRPGAAWARRRRDRRGSRRAWSSWRRRGPEPVAERPPGERLRGGRRVVAGDQVRIALRGGRRGSVRRRPAAGRSVQQSGTRQAQRGANGQPTSVRRRGPAATPRWASARPGAARSRRGSERSSPTVYGCAGSRQRRPPSGRSPRAARRTSPRRRSAKPGHDAQVVGDDQDRHAQLRRGGAAAAPGSGPGWSRRARSWARPR